jgi:hypothetical protein
VSHEGEGLAGLALDQSAKHKLHDRGLKDQQQDKESEKFGEDFGDQNDAPVLIYEKQKLI